LGSNIAAVNRLAAGSMAAESGLKVPTNGEVLARWDKFAALYSKHFRMWSLPAYHALLSALDVGEPSVNAMLEIGSGPGHFLKTMRAELPEQAELVGSDFSGEMVALAKAVTVSLPKTKVIEADAQALPTEFGGGFDRIMANLCIHIAPDPDAAVSEMSRVCCPGALAGASVWGQRASSILFTILDDSVKACRERGDLPPADAPPQPSRSQFHLGDDATCRSLFEKHGFENVVSFHVACPWPSGFAKGGEGFAKLWLQAMPQALELTSKLDKAAAEALEKEVAAKADAALKDGSPIMCDVLCIAARRPTIASTGGT